ncbi:MAG: hypothetical protein ABI903_16490 [Actinomycetota bacterium]
MNLTDRAAIGQIIAATVTTSAKPISAVVDSHASAVKYSTAARNLGVPQGVLAAAVTAALQRGDDPASCPEVQRVATASQISGEGVSQGVDAIVFETFREAAHNNADQLVESWRVPFDKAAATLTAAHQSIGNLALDDAAAIMLKGGDIAKVWGEAREAAATIDRIIMGWSALGEFTRLANRDQSWNVLRLAVVDLDTIGSLDPRKISPWEAVLAGLELDLPTFTEYQQRVRAIENAKADWSRQADQRNTDALTGRRVTV